MTLVIKLYYVETATIDVEVNVALLKIRGHRFPHMNLWVHPFYLTPCGISDTLAMNVGRDKK